jgi:hypothetical protein
MTTYDIWIRLANGSTTHVLMQASDVNAAKMLAESMYGASNVISVVTYQSFE